MKQRKIYIAARLLGVLGVLVAASAAPARAISSGVAGISATDGDVVDCLSPTGGGGIINTCAESIPVFINLSVTTSGTKTYELIVRGSTNPGSVTCRAIATDRYGAWQVPYGAQQTASLHSVYTHLSSSATVPAFGGFMAVCTLGPGAVIQSANW